MAATLVTVIGAPRLTLAKVGTRVKTPFVHDTPTVSGTGGRGPASGPA